MSDSITNSWKCTVCGYVHHGDSAPDCCPLCGAGMTAFEAVASSQEPPIKQAPSKWRCLICGYQHDGDSPPGKCPLCGAAADEFEPVVSDDTDLGVSDVSDEIVVVGGGIAGFSAIETMRSINSNAKITLISREPYLPYYRLNLTRFLAGEIQEDTLPIKPQSWYDDNGIEVLLNEDVVDIDLSASKVVLESGGEVSYQKLILATGAHPFIPPFPGAGRENVLSIRSLDQVKSLRDMKLEGKKCVCIGGGILGLETAAGLARRGADVTVLEGYGWLLPRQLNQKASELLLMYVQNLGIKVISGAKTKEIVGDERVWNVTLEDGSDVPADLVIITTGVRSNTCLARKAGLDVNNGIVVDHYMQTSNENIYAAGDTAEFQGQLYGIWNPAQYQGSIAGMNALGQKAEFGGIPRSNTIKVMGVDMFSIGQIKTEDGSYTVLEDSHDDTYRAFIFRDNLIVGCILLGDTKLAAVVKDYIEKKKDLSSLLSTNPTASDAVKYFSSN